MKKKKNFKNLFKKLKKTNPYFRFTFFATFIIYFISIFFMIYGLSLLSGIETLIRIIVIVLIILYLLIFLLSGIIMLITKKKTGLIIFCIFSLIFSTVNIIGYYYIKKTYNVVDDISKEKIVYTTDLIALDKNTDIKTVGMLKDEQNIEGYILPQEYIATNGKKWKIKYFDNRDLLVNALFKKEVDAVFITANYKILFADDEKYSDIAEKTVVIDSLSKELNNQDTVSSSNKSVTEPFTVLLLGVDSEYDGLANNAAFNGDSIMLITFNPKTLSATVFSIPRDTYVPIACNNNKSFKINSAAGYGTKCMINTVQNLTNITIDYYVKINFKGVVSLVEALGGIDVDVDKPDYNHNLSIDCGGKVCEQNSNREFGKNTVYITPGLNVHLNGEQALAYARNRHQWALSDFKRVEHQQAIVTSIANKAKTIRNINTFYKVLNAISNNIDTNMATKEMLNFYNVGKNILLNNNFSDGEFINIQKTYLTGYDLSVFINGMSTYTYQYYEESLKEIVKAMKVNLELEKPEIIKTFSFSVNKPYEITTIGKTYTAVKRNETLPNFVGSSINYLMSWASSRGLSINKTYNESSSCTNDIITEQSVHSGTLVSSISSLNVNICKNDTTSTKPDDNSQTITTTTTTKKPELPEELTP